MSESLPASHPRLEWQNGPGFTYIADTTFRVLDAVSEQELEPLVSTTHTHLLSAVQAAIPESVLSLHLASNHLRKMIPDECTILNQDYGVSTEDVARAQPNAAFSGIGEMEFTWQFAPAVAKATVDHLVEQQQVQPDELENMSLGDWAGIIGSPSFSRTAHVLAYTINGIYGPHGSQPKDFEEDRFRQRLLDNDIIIDDDAPLFETIQTAESSGKLPAVQPSKELIQSLRQRLQQEPGSQGCPVARFAVTLPADMLDTDPHAQHLIQSGRAEVIRETEGDEQVRLRLIESPIQASLGVLATKLTEYEARYGSPTLDSSKTDYRQCPVDHIKPHNVL